MLKDYFQDVSPVYNNAVCVCVFTFAVFIFCLSSLPLACDILPTDCLTVQNSGLDYSWTSVSVCLCLSPVIVLKEMRGLQFFLIYILLMVKVWCKHTLGPKTETILSFGFNYVRITCGI